MKSIINFPQPCLVFNKNNLETNILAIFAIYAHA